VVERKAEGKPSLYMVEPSGTFWVRCPLSSFSRRFLPVLRDSDDSCSRRSKQGYRGCAIGKGRQLAKTEIEKLELENLTAEEALVEAARMYVSLFPLSFALSFPNSLFADGRELLSRGIVR
jgi:20S proteasome subunit alpha 7